MKSFLMRTNNGTVIRFRCYEAEAPLTTSAFFSLLPFKGYFMHARVSGEEIWADKVPAMNVIQENASVFTKPGEVVYGPSKPARTKTCNAMGIYYGEGKGLDAANIFAIVYEEDLPILKLLGEKIWKGGQQEMTFELITS